MTNSADQPLSGTRLLGRLVQRGFGAGQLEVMATFALTALLEEEDTARDFTAWLADKGAVSLPADIQYVAEAAVPGGRVDIAGFDAEVMRVVGEAKFDAEITAAQVRHYLQAAPDAQLLVLLVPETRRRETQRVLSSLAADVASLVLSWEEVCDGLDATRAARTDVEQFRALCEAATGLEVAPLRQQDMGPKRTARLHDLHAITDRVSATVHHRLNGGRLYPLQRLDADGFTGYRYVCPAGRDVCLAVGVRTYETAPDGPLWLRWHRDTGGRRGVDGIAHSLTRAGLDPTRDGGHVWVHLPAPVEIGAQQVVRELTEQVIRAHEATIAQSLTQSPTPSA